MAIEACGLILQSGFVSNLGSSLARRAGSLLIALGVIGTFGSIVWWQNFYTQLVGRAPVECLYELRGPCQMVSNVTALFGATAYDARLLWASGIAMVIGLLLQR